MSAMDKVFISHASADKAVADLLRDTLVLGGVPEGHIFYSSSRASGIPSGVDVRTRLRAELKEAALVLELVSSTFLERPMCLLELGAAWALEKPTYPIVVPPLTRSKAIQQIGDVQMGVFGNSDDIDGVFDELHDRLEVDIGVEVRAAAWNRSIRDFKTRLPKLISQAGSPPSVPRRPSESAPAQGHSRSPKIEIVSYSAVPSSFGTEIHGEATNNDSVEHAATIKATFFDADGNIVGTADGIVSQLAPGDTKTFSLTSINGVPEHSTMKVQVDAVF